jgi:GT2 family glycosyltransferase
VAEERIGNERHDRAGIHKEAVRATVALAALEGRDPAEDRLLGAVQETSRKLDAGSYKYFPLERRPMKSSKISVVIVTFNSRELIDTCLAPIYDQCIDIEIVVWDNASRDGTGDYLEERYPYLRVIRSQENVGFAAGNNAALQYCSGQYILLLNPDAFLQSSQQLRELSACLDEYSDVAAVAPQLLNDDGSHQVGDCGWKTNFVNVISHVFFFHRLFSFLPSIYLSNNLLLRRPFVSVDWLSGACLMVRSSVIRDVGALDDSIFMYGEDVEWGERMRSAGYYLVFMPLVKVFHYQGGSQRNNKGLFMSTQWLDRIYMRLSRQYSLATLVLIKAMFSLGLSARAIIHGLWALVTRDRSRLTRASLMLAYARHAASLRCQSSKRENRESKNMADFRGPSGTEWKDAEKSNPVFRQFVAVGEFSICSLFRITTYDDIVERLASHSFLRPVVSLLFGWRIDTEIERLGVLFIHIPKNAGVSYSHALYRRQVWHRTARYYRAVRPSIFKTCDSFALLRDPVERCLSAYEFLRAGGSARAVASQKIARIVKDFKSIHEYLDYVSENINKPFMLDNVMRCQRWFIEDLDSRVIVKRLFILEEDAQALESYLDKLGIREVPAINVTLKKQISEKSDSRVLERIGMIYAADYALIESVRNSRKDSDNVLSQ